MKTTLEQLIEKIRDAKEAALNEAKSARHRKEDSSGADGMFVGLSMANKFANELLETEKQQIVESFAEGRLDAQIGEYQSGEMYFSETFKQQK